MNPQLIVQQIQKSIIPLFISTLIIGLFYWQFTKVYPYIIQHFTEDKLSILYAHLLVYIFLIQTLFISLVNLINNLILRSKVFVLVTIFVLLIFYTLSFSIIKDILQYFMISNPLEENVLIGMMFFVVGTLLYSLYSMGILFVRKVIPYTHILVFTLLALIYGSWFIDTYCYPIAEFLSKFE